MAEIEWNNLVSDLVNNCEEYHQHFYSINNFTGPSYHFHKRALETYGQEKIEMIYALLTSWGMHRMGGGPKLEEFEKFKENLEKASEKINKLSAVTIEDCAEENIIILEEIFGILKPMKSSKKLTAFSKVIAHYLPKLVAPVDGEYTLRFINCRLNSELPSIKLIRSEDEFQMFKEIHWSLFKEVALNEKFKYHANDWTSQHARFKWDTSIPKIIDNLIVGKIGSLKNKKL